MIPMDMPDAIPARTPARARARAFVIAALATAVTAGAIGYLVHIWPEPEPFVVPRDRPEATGLLPMAPIAGTKVANDQCLIFLDEWMRHPNWKVVILRAERSWCGNSSDGDQFFHIEADGKVTLEMPNAYPPREPRTWRISPVLLHQLHQAALESCAAPEKPEDFRLFVAFGWGTAPSGNASTKAFLDSNAGRAVDEFLDAAIEAGTP
jgi:hypothetical protein